MRFDDLFGESGEHHTDSSGLVKETVRCIR